MSFFAAAIMAMVTVYPATLGAADARFQASTASRIHASLNREWTFDYFPSGQADALGCEAVRFDDSSWPAVAVPHTWSTYETTGELHPYIRNPNEHLAPYWWCGWGWYRKHLVIDRSQAGRKVFIEFDGVQKYCKLWLNGKYLGDHKGAYHSFSFDVTDAVNFGGDNVIAIAVSDRQQDPFRIPVMDGGNFDLYGGIYRDVRMVITDRLYVPYQGSDRQQGGTFITTPEVSAQSATVRIRTWLRNDYPESRECDLVTTLLDGQGRRVLSFGWHRTIQPGALAEFDDTRILENPHLWSPAAPQLYTAVSEVRQGGTTVDRFDSTFGVRSIRWQVAAKTEGNVLFVNERPVNLQGFISHQEYPWLGDAQPTWLRLADLRDMKENLGANFFRSGHYTTDRAVYDYCDRNGLLVVEDVPNVKDKDFSRTVQEQQVREMIRRDRNRPSIFAWCMGDESNKPADSKWAHEEDPTRYIHARDCPGPASGQFISLPAKSLRLGRLMACTVRGWSGAEEWSLEPKNHQSTSNEERQHTMGMGGGLTTDTVTGRDASVESPNMIVWLYEDHGCARTYQNEPVLNINPKGWVDAYRFPKLAYYLWQANHVSKPMVFVHPQYWRAQYIGQKRNFIVDSNCDSVELEIDGRRVGVLQPSDRNFHVITFRDVPVQRGTLAARGLKSGKEVVDELPVTVAPARVVLTETHESAEAALNTVIVVKADIVDSLGHHVLGATDTVHWSVQGQATLVGPAVYATDIHKNMELDGTMYTDMPVSNVIRSTGLAGRVVVRAQVAGLQLGEVSVDLVSPATSASGPIHQPPVEFGQRLRVKRLLADISEPPPQQEIAEPARGLNFKSQDLDSATCRDFVMDQIRRIQPTVDTGSPEFAALADTLARELVNNRGELPSADLSFAIRNYNLCRQITRMVENTALPKAVKSDFRAYYADQMIRQANPMAVSRERARIDSVPTDARPVPAASSNVADLLSSYYPALARAGEAAREAALARLFRINPRITRRELMTGDRKTDDQRRVISYTTGPGALLLMPSLAWLTASSG